MTFVGPVALAGLGQVFRKYAWLIGSDYIEYPQEFKGGLLAAIVLPIPSIISKLKADQKRATKSVFFTVCETEPVHDDYRLIFELGDTFYVPSEFCSRILKKQFPQGNFPVLRNFAGPPIEPASVPLPDLTGKFVFYHIGNVIDPRKNIKALMECFLRAQVPNSVLLLKASCLRKVQINLPNVIIVEDFLSDAQMETIHRVGHCYVSMAHSEGAGMGAIEAAIRHKQVIVPEYGATKEYVPSAMLVRCTPGKVPFDDFLFQEGMEWGDPDPKHMIELMQTVAKRPVAHPVTHELMSKVPLELLKICDA